MEEVAQFPQPWIPGYGRPWGCQLWKRFYSLYGLASQGMVTSGEERCGREVCSIPDAVPQALSSHVLANNGRGGVTSSLAWLNRA